MVMKDTDMRAPNSKQNKTIDDDIRLQNTVKPTDKFIISSIPVTTIKHIQNKLMINALGTIRYDSRQVGTISSKVEGRIEKMYVRYRYQYIGKGQRVFDMYSPELLTTQENLIFLLKSDPENSTLIKAAEERLLLFGLNPAAISQIINRKKALRSVSVFSNYSGYITEAGNNNIQIQQGLGFQQKSASPLVAEALQNTDLPIKEGTYLQKGQQVFNVINSSRVLISLNIFPDQANYIKKGSLVNIIAETAPDKKIKGTIDYIEPFFKQGSKTLSARVYLNNSKLKLPIGSSVKAVIYSEPLLGYWLPANCVLSTGIKNIVFKKDHLGFEPRQVSIGMKNEDLIQILSGLENSDSVAINAQQLIGSESIIKIK